MTKKTGASGEEMRRSTTGGKTLPVKRSIKDCEVGEDCINRGSCLLVIKDQDLRNNDAVDRDRGGLKVSLFKHLVKHRPVKEPGDSKQRKRAVVGLLNQQLEVLRLHVKGKKVADASVSTTVSKNARRRIAESRLRSSHVSAAVVLEGEAKARRKAFKGCRELLSKLFNHTSYAKSTAPIDYESYVLKPMELNAVQFKLNSGDYENPTEFASNMRLSIGKTMEESSPGHYVYGAAEALLQIFNDRWDPIEAEYIRGLKLAKLM